MNNTRGHMLQWWPYGFLASHIAAVIAFLASPHAEELPATTVSIGVFVLGAFLWPVCRPDPKTLISPRNIALLLFWLQLVLLPLVIAYTGFSPGTLPALPSTTTINLSLLLHAGAYAAFGFGFQWGLRRMRQTSQPSIPLATDPRWGPKLIALFLIIGLVGLVLAFPSWDDYVAYLNDPNIQKQRDIEMSTFPRAAATFFRPFLTFALVLIWGYWLSRGRRPRPLWTVVAVTVLLGVALPFLNFNYNRGSMFGPVLALAAVFSCYVRRLSLPVLATAGGVLFFAAFLLGSYRAGKLQRSDFVGHSPSWAAEAGAGEVADLVQVYGNAPQFSAFMMERIQTASDLYGGRTLVSSLLYPVPILGKPFRASSGVEIYNQLIYGTPRIVDQVITYEAELYMNFHLAGVLIGYAVVGLVFSWFHGRFERATTPIGTFAWLLMGLWVVWPGSLPVTSQQFIYAFCPFYFYAVLGWLRTRIGLQVGRRDVLPVHPAAVPERQVAVC